MDAKNQAGDGKWCVSGTDETFNGADYETREEAIACAPEELADEVEPGGTFYTGRAAAIDPVRFSADLVLDSLREAAYDDCGEASESFLEDVTREQEQDLERRLHAATWAWLREHGLEPRCFTVVEIERHTMPSPAAAAGEGG